MTQTDTTGAAGGPTDKPWHLQGNWAPVMDELTVGDLEVRGELPDGLDGTYIRAGMNPRSGWSEHWFFGSGMLHSVEVGDGRATYRNRFVQTPYLTENMDLMTAMGSLDYSPANTNIVNHAGRFFALEEAHRPWEVNADLSTVGAVSFNGKLDTPMTAHPKICPETGEMMFFGYQMLAEPWLTYHRADANGNLVQSEAIEIPKPVMMHDFNITRTRTIFMDMPITFSLEQAGFGWDPDNGARLGVMDRDGAGSDIRWYEIDPCYVFHPVNSYDNGEQIVLHVARFESSMTGGLMGRSVEPAMPMLYEWIIDPAKGTVSERQMDDRHGDFCRVDDRLVGLKARYGYILQLAGLDSDQEYGHELYRYDLTTGGCEVHDLGANSHGGEAVFVPRDAGAGEDDGWLVLIAHDETENQSRFVVIDSQDFTGDPVAEVMLPQRVPYGAHGNWFGGLHA
ncbi:MAG: carotenoid oxygenase family protein [Actinomycetia bacterium]|nr:carotenoid oxygenase family protein [Actinomycetes bacterium]